MCVSAGGTKDDAPAKGALALLFAKQLAARILFQLAFDHVPRGHCREVVLIEHGVELRKRQGIGA